MENLIVKLAETPEEIHAAKRLRYQVFFEEMGANRPDTAHSGATSTDIDEDKFDAYCDHLIAHDSASGQIIGTYRILAPEQAKAVGCWYSEDEFDLSALKPLAGQLIEVGRSCVHQEYRSGTVIAMLWSGLMEYMQQRKYQYLAGCASIPLAQGEIPAAYTVHRLKKYWAPEAYRVHPHHPWDAPELPEESTDSPKIRHALPPLLKGYVRAGAWVCGPPAYDPQFNTIDVFILMPMSNIKPQHVRRFVKRGNA